uniref:Transcription initiation factor TFIID subunit 2 n=1 Tax=Parastrongyloides trichosuri TaxID=131310 RepID=A0A0N4ZJ39_PARTI
MSLQPEEPLPYRVISQLVCIKNMDFQKKTFQFRTELAIAPLKKEIFQLELHIGNDILLPNEIPDESMVVSMEGEDVVYIRRNLFKKSNSNTMQYNENDIHFLKYQSNQYKKAMNVSNVHQRMLITLNKGGKDKVKNSETLNVCIEGMVKNPQHGIHFTTLLNEENLDGVHMYTIRTSNLSSTHQWLPCIDFPNNLQIWRFEITTPAEYMAAAVGELIDVSLQSNGTEKCFIFEQVVPTSPMNVGFAAGNLHEYSFGDVPKVSCYYPPNLLPLVKHTMEHQLRTLEFYEELLGCKFPFNNYHIIFVDELERETQTYSSLTIVNLSLLYHKKVFDTVRDVRQHFAHAVAQQYFGCLVNIYDWLDIWLIRSLARFLTTLYVEKYFGHSEYMYQISKIMEAVCTYESKYGPIFLRPFKDCEKTRMISRLQCQTQAKFLSENEFPGSLTEEGIDKLEGKWKGLHFDPRSPETASPIYVDNLYRKGHFLLRVLQMRLGKDTFFKVIQRVLSMALTVSEKLSKCAEWENMCVSTESFFKTITNITGQELPSFMEQCIYGGGHANFDVQYSFNKKKNMIELQLTQEAGNDKGFQTYVGPLTVVVQESDGPVHHTIQIDSKITKHDLNAKSKGRRLKKKKVPLHTGDEVEIDLTSLMDTESPVLWIRFDPDLQLVRRVRMRQPQHNWQYMLRYERDVLAQFVAIENLEPFANSETQELLLESLDNTNFFYRVKIAAAEMLIRITNKLNMEERVDITNPSKILQSLKKFFSCKSSLDLPRSNNYLLTSTHLQHYFLTQALPISIAKLKGRNNIPNMDAFNFILNLHKYNDNSLNRYADDFYRSCIITAMGNLIYPNKDNKDLWNVNKMNPDIRRVLSEITFAYNMDMMIPSYGRVVTVACIKGLYKLMLTDHIPLEPNTFIPLCKEGVYFEIRKTAFLCLIDMMGRIRTENMVPVFDFVLNTCLETNNTQLKYQLAYILSTRPIFDFEKIEKHGLKHPLNNPEVMKKLWLIINNDKYNSLLRLSFADMFYEMYGNFKPMKSE